MAHGMLISLLQIFIFQKRFAKNVPTARQRTPCSDSASNSQEMPRRPQPPPPPPAALPDSLGSVHQHMPNRFKEK